MSFSNAQFLTVLEVVAGKCAAADTFLNFIIPTPLLFTDSADVYANLAPLSGQKAIETTLINALWIDYLRFEDANNESDSPVKTIYLELTLFHESDNERINDADDFEKRVLKTKQNHVADIFSLCAEFQGITPIDLGAEFAVCEVRSLVQIDNTQRDVGCAFIRSSKVTGSQTKLGCAVKVQTVAC